MPDTSCSWSAWRCRREDKDAASAPCADKHDLISSGSFELAIACGHMEICRTRHDRTRDRKCRITGCARGSWRSRSPEAGSRLAGASRVARPRVSAAAALGGLPLTPSAEPRRGARRTRDSHYSARLSHMSRRWRASTRRRFRAAWCAEGEAGREGRVRAGPAGVL